MESMTNNNNNSITNGNGYPENNKKTRGRQKIQMKKIEKDSDMMITFSKRRSGIYKKASELVTLAGCEIGFLVFSPAGKAFTFAHPSFNHIVGRYLGQRPEPPSPYNLEALRHAEIQHLTKRYTDLLDLYGEEQKKEATLLAKMAGKSLDNWWNKSIDDVLGNEIQGLEQAYLEVLHWVEQRKVDITMRVNCIVNPTLIYQNYNNVMNMHVNVAHGDHGGDSSFSFYHDGMQQQMDMGPMMAANLPAFPVVGLGPNGANGNVGLFPVVGPNGIGNEAGGSISMVGSSGSGYEGMDSPSMLGFYSM